jgi:hypothetical protein
VLVTGTTTPRFNWGGCKVATVAVQAVDGDDQPIGDLVWSVDGAMDGDGVRNNVIETGVTYGELPPRATTVVQPSPLQTGQRYRVVIGMTDPGGGFGSQVGTAGAGFGFFTR